MKQRQKGEARAIQIKVSRTIDSNLLDQHKHDDDNINKSQDSQSNDKAHSDKMGVLNIG